MLLELKTAKIKLIKLANKTDNKKEEVMKKKKFLTILISLSAVVIAGLSVILAVFIKPTKADDSSVKPATSEEVEQITIAGTAADASIAEKGGEIYVGPGSKYVMSGGTINGKSNTFGGAVYVSAGGTFIMEGGTITGCEAYWGGAIYIENGATCYINGGKIETCYAERGGAVYVENGGVLKTNTDPETGEILINNPTVRVAECKYKKYESVVNVYVDGTLTTIVTQKTKVVKEENLPLSYEETCGYYLDENLTQGVSENTDLTEVVESAPSVSTFTAQAQTDQTLEVNLFTKKATTSGLTYTLNSSGTSYSVKQTASISGEVVIAREYNNKPVNTIADNGFSGRTTVTSVVLPNTVKTIGTSAFSLCTKLNSVYIGSGVRTINSSAFNGCSSLVRVYLPKTVKTIGAEAFNGCPTNMKVFTNIENTESVPSGWGDWNSNNGSVINVLYNSSFKDYNYPDRIKEENPNLIFDGLKITGYVTAPTGDLVIPEGVVEIGSKAFENCTGITSVAIPNSVTSIGGSAFYNCTGITSVAIPNSVTSIGNFAFDNCKGLTNVTFSSSVTSIGAFAFRYCTGLTSLSIPNSVTSIGSYAFNSCEGLTSVTIGNSVTSIDSSAFFGCTGLTSVNITDINKWAEIEFNQYHANPLYYAKHLYINNQEVTEVNLTTATKIGSYAFYNYKALTSVTIGDSVTSIGALAFYNCTGLTRVNITNLNKWAEIEFNLYSSNPLYYAKHLYINNQEVTEVNLTTATKIGSYAFYYCEGLTSIEIPNSVTSIGALAFSCCTGLTSINIPNSVTSIGGSAFSGCTGLTSVTIGDSVTSIGGSVFSGCTGLTSVTIPNSVTSIEYYVFKDCTGLTSVTIGNSVTSIGVGAFSGCTGLTSINIPNSVTSIGGSAFKNCTGLTSVTIPNSVTSIGNAAFSSCTGLTSVYLPSTVQTIGSNIFNSCSLSLVIYTDLKETDPVPTGWDETWNSNGSQTLEVVYEIESLEAKIINIYVDSVLSKSLTVYGNTYKVKEANMPLDYEHCCGYFLNETLTKTIENDIVNLTGNEVNIYTKTAFIPSEFTFSGNIVYIPTVYGDEVNDAGGDYIFYENIILPREYNGTTLTIVACDDYEERVVLEPSDVDDEYIGIGVASMIIPSTITAIEDYSFYECFDLSYINLPNSVTRIGEDAFSHCTGLTRVDIADTNAWAEIEFGNLYANPLYHAYGLYIDNEEVTEVNLTTATKISSYAFYGCTGLTSVTIGNGVTSIGDSAFEYCTGLTNIEIPSSVTSIGGSAFNNCTGLTSINIPSSVTSIGSDAFYFCTGLTSVYLPSTVQTIGSYPFNFCSTSLVIYTDLAEGATVPTGWGSMWNKINSSTTLTVVYGCSLSEYESIVQSATQTFMSFNVERLNDAYLTNDILLTKRRVVL